MAAREQLQTITPDAATANVPAATNAPSGKWVYVALHTRATVQDTNVTKPSASWELVAEAGATGGSAFPHTLIYRVQSSGSESGTYDFSTSAESFTVASSWWVSGADDDATLLTGTDDNGTSDSDTFDAPSVASVPDEALVIRFWSQRRNFPHDGTVAIDTANDDYALPAATDDLQHTGMMGWDLQSGAGATGTKTATLSGSTATQKRWSAITLVIPTEPAPAARITPEHISTRDSEAEDPGLTAGSILVPVPSGIGTAQNEVVFVGLMSQQRLRHSMMTTVPTGFTFHSESSRPATDAQDQPHILWYALVDPTVAQPSEWEWVTSETWESAVTLVQPTVMRYKHVDRTDPFGGGTPTWTNFESAGTVATAPAATPDDVDSIRLVSAATRRIGDDWTFADELTDRSPTEPDANSLSGIGEEPVTALTEMGTRDLGHTNYGTPGGYRWVAGSVFILGAADDGSPGAPDHTGTKPVSWESALLQAAPDESHPNATTSIEVYRHTATMAGDPVTNGTLIHTFGPGGGSVVHSSGWSPESEYFLQMRAVNAEGSTLGPEFQITTWSQAAHVLTTAQTLVVPMEIVTGGVDIDKSEYHGSNVDESSWAYTHPGGSLLVFVSARDPDGLATMDQVTWNGVATMKVRGSASALTDEGSRIFGGIFWMLDAPAGTFTLAASTSGGAPTQFRWQVHSLSGPSLAVNATAFNGDDPLGSVQVDVTCEVNDRLFDYLAWTLSAVNVASIGANQTQLLADDSPTRQNGTTALATAENRNPDGTLSMTHTGDDPSPNNKCGYWGVSISSEGGAATMRSLRADVGLAALNDEDLWHV